MIYPLVSELADDGIAVSVTCRVLKIARQPYYRWRNQPVTDADWRDAHRANALFDAWCEDKQFGHRLLADRAGIKGYPMCDRAAWRLCRDNGWQSVTVKRIRKTPKKPGPAVCDDKVRRDFTAACLNDVWLTDITEHPTREGKLYLCAVKDVFSNRIVGYSISSTMTAALACTAIDNAVINRNGDVVGCVVHSDRGAQFRSQEFAETLRKHYLIASMGRVGAAGDNAAMESFFSLLQKNVLNQQEWDTREQLRTAIITWIERTYHRRRKQRKLGRLTPIEYETTIETNTLISA